MAEHDLLGNENLTALEIYLFLHNWTSATPFFVD